MQNKIVCLTATAVGLSKDTHAANIFFSRHFRVLSLFFKLVFNYISFHCGCRKIIDINVSSGIHFNYFIPIYPLFVVLKIS